MSVDRDELVRQLEIEKALLEETKTVKRMGGGYPAGTPIFPHWQETIILRIWLLERMIAKAPRTQRTELRRVVNLDN